MNIPKPFKYFETLYCKISLETAFLKKEQAFHASLSLYDLLSKEGITFVALGWTASNFTVIRKVRQPELHCMRTLKCGLTKLIYEGRITSLFLKEKFLFIKPSIVLALPIASGGHGSTNPLTAN